MFVASTEFVEAAETQAKALGFSPAAVFVAHPVQGRTDEEIQTLADNAIRQILGEICASE
jgi:hypothetical protein